MSSFEAIGMTNYFRVRDLPEFIDALGDYPAVVFKNSEDPSLISLSAECYDDQGWHDTTRDGQKFSIFATVAKHLEDGEVAVFMQVGGDRLRYLGGKAIAVNSAGKRTTVDLSDIYEKAKTLSPDGSPPLSAQD